MDRLVSVDVDRLDLSFRPSRRSSASLTVTNLMHTMSVAVHLSVSSPGGTHHLSFSISPATPHLLAPLSSATFSLSLAPLDRAPPPTSPLTILLVKSAVFPIGKPDPTALSRLFSRPGAALVFRDAAIPISLLGPHVLDALLLDDQTPPLATSSSIVSRSLASCSQFELSALLRRSAAAGRPEFLSALLSAGADPRGGPDGRSALSLAVSSGCLPAVEILVASGATIDLARDRVFHEAAGANRVDLIKILEQSGGLDPGWPGSVDAEGRTPVHYAAAHGHLEAVQACLDSGLGKLDRADLAGWTPLHCAADGGFLDLARFLIERSSFDPKITVTVTGKTPLDLAMDAGHSHLYDLLGLSDELLRAATMGDVDCVRRCIAGGAGVRQRDQNGWTALHRAAFGGWTEVARVLINSGAQLDMVDDAGWTPLRCAVESGQVEAALLLVGQGAKARLKGLKKADLFSMRLDQCAVKSCNLLSLAGETLDEVDVFK